MYEVARAGLFRTFHPPKLQLGTACSRLPSKNYSPPRLGDLSRLNQHFGITQVKGNKRPRLVRKVDLLIGVYFVLA